MPYADRERNLEYLRRYHERTRPRPVPVPQDAGGDLPPHGTLLADEDGSRVQCHVCGRWLSSMPLHIRRAHGLSADDYKARYGLARGASLWSPRTQELQRQAALARGAGEIGRAPTVRPAARQLGGHRYAGARPVAHARSRCRAHGVQVFLMPYHLPTPCWRHVRNISRDNSEHGTNVLPNGWAIDANTRFPDIKVWAQAGGISSPWQFSDRTDREDVRELELHVCHYVDPIGEVVWVTSSRPPGGPRVPPEDGHLPRLPARAIERPAG